MGKDFLKTKSIECNCSGFREKKPVDVVFFFWDSSFDSNPRTQIPEDMTKIIIFKTHIV